MSLLKMLRRAFTYVPPFEPLTDVERRLFDDGYRAAIFLEPYDPPVRAGRSRDSYDAGFQAGEMAFSSW